MITLKSVIVRSILDGAKLSCSEVWLPQGNLPSALCSRNWHLPPILQAAHEENASDYSYAKAFEDLTLAVRRAKFDLPGKIRTSDISHPIFEIDAAVIADAIREAAWIIKNQPTNLDLGACGSASLKLVGVTIRGDLDLSRLELPFSIRLIACRVEGALLLDRTRLSTLDLSGSILSYGLSANYVVINGACRARRTVSLGPVDLGAARISGTTDFTDSILVPINRASPLTSFVGDRGILNLALAQMGADMRMGRARIYGGVNVRGAGIDGLLYMNDAVLRCAIAYFEIMALAAQDAVLKGLDKRSRSRIKRLDKEYQRSVPERIVLEAADRIAMILHPPSGDSKADISRRFVEVLGGNLFEPLDWSSVDFSLQFQLLRESKRAAESAFRAEGTVISGPVNANGVRISGRVRFKSVQTGGGVSFNGAKIRTVRCMRHDISAFRDHFSRIGKASWGESEDTASVSLLTQILDALENEENGLSATTKSFRTEYALDFRGAIIKGPLDFGRDRRSRESDKPGNTDRLLLQQVAKVISSTEEDPFKYLPIFKHGTVDSAPSLHPKDHKLETEFRKLGKKWDPHHYQFEEELAEREAARLKAKAKVDKIRLEEIPKLERLVSQKRKEVLSARTKLLSTTSGPERFAIGQRINRLRKEIVVAVLELRGLRRSLNQGWSEFFTAAKRSMTTLLKFPFKYHTNEIDSETKTKITSELVNAAKKYGALKATVLIGEIRLDGADIRGDLIFTGMIANIFNDKQFGGVNDKSDWRDLIRMKNIKVEGDIDFRHSIGLSSINGNKAVVGGSVRFCDSIKYSTKRMNYHPVRSRAFFPEIKGNSRKIRFERALIGGDINFLFDRQTGPDINASSAKVDGMVHILPARFGLQMHKDDLERLYPSRSRQNVAEHATLPKIAYAKVFFSLFVRQILFFVPGIRSWYKQVASSIGNDVVVAVEQVRQKVSRIDLRNMTCSVFAHPPSAWPKQDGLLVVGMKYADTTVIGPLLPRWKSWPSVWSDLIFNSGRRMTAVTLLLLILALMMMITAFFYLRVLAPEQQAGLPFALLWFKDQFGFVNMIGLLSFVISAIIYKIVMDRIRPTQAEGQPLAIRWLKLQRRTFNPQRILREMRPSQPYVQAASVLRMTGNNSSADRVELERIRERTRGLSRRSTGFVKAVLRALDVFMEYGFNPVRGIIVVSIIFLATSSLNHFAAKQNIIVERGPNFSCELSDDLDEFVCLKMTSKDESENEKPSTNFHAPYYTLDVFLPFVDLGPEQNWQVVDLDEQWWQEVLYAFVITSRLFGWLLITLIGVSIVIRTESILSRSEAV